MGRKQKTSPIEDLVEIVAMMPWWAGVALAVVSYFGLHYVATSEVPHAVRPSDIGAVMSGTVWKTLAMIGQYAIPICCLAGSAISFFKRRKRVQLFSDVAASTSASTLGDMTWQEFEVLVGEAFRQKGFTVAETGGGGADGGVDLALRKQGEKFLVQCKQWRAYKVSVNTVRELYGVMAAQGATGGYVVTSGEFTPDAKEFADGRNIELIDGTRLFEMIRLVRDAVDRGAIAAEESTANKMDAPNCPRCGRQMVRRMAKKGANAGDEFWGCSGFPECKGTRAIA